MKRLTLILGLLFLVGACKPDLPDGDTIIKELYDKKVAVLNKQRQERCKKAAVEKHPVS